MKNLEWRYDLKKRKKKGEATEGDKRLSMMTEDERSAGD